jgi:hypothetical protein
METTITVPARKKAVASVSGRVFYCISASAAFKVQADSRDKVTSGTGETYGSPEGRAFKRLTFYNSTANDIAVRFYAGFEDYKTNTVTNISLLNVTAASTYTRAHTSNTLTAGDTVEFSGLFGSDVRKQIAISNNDATAVLEVLDGDVTGGHASDVGQYIQPKTTWGLETNGIIRLHNPSGSAINYAVLETFYTPSA